MDSKDANSVFDYLESVAQKDGKVTKAEFDRWHEKIGPDLDEDGVVSKHKLYRLAQTTKSVYTGRNITCYQYKTEPHAGFVPYMIQGEHVSEFDLACITTEQWVRNFNDLIGDGEITREEFVQRCQSLPQPVKK
jgi:hypothetical protein